MADRKTNWKRNLLKVPNVIERKIAQMGNRPVRATVAKEIRESEIRNEMYAHLGVLLDGERIRHPQAVVPPPDSGKWSRTNIEGAVKVLKDEPMVTRTWSVETPNFGDWSKGTHSVEWSKEVYQRRFIAPRELAIKIEVLGRELGPDPLYVIGFAVDAVLVPGTPSFAEDLLYVLNLLQENVGDADVNPADSTPEEYLATLRVKWEILPPGERDANIALIIRGRDRMTDEDRAVLVERYKFLESLKPTNFVVGESGFSRYFGAQFAEDVVVFENVEYGNALYVMGENWRVNSQLSRTELLAKAQRDFVRIPHTTGWKARARQVIMKAVKQSHVKKAAPSAQPHRRPGRY